MTKEEFIQEAALRMLSSHLTFTMKEVVENARSLADELFPEQEQKSVVYPAELDAEPIENLLKEIDKQDREEVEARRARNRKDWPGRRDQKGGYYKRLSKVFREQGIETVGDLLDMRSYKFLQLKNVGQLCFVRVNNILGDLYGITAW